ncbi:oligosaccharide flippase family protein [Agrococcus sp. SCSIO52902]|uniref:lipopolysaccharide biosynthesis protein n=1 Tax=Agrococcus sp. SCSIO52902 TaxID=2933290 RepID=UPI001FF36A3A|nr:oligosaccharide flippase family protein [Agrococcus sp. SCSIO52902]UOW00790.1 oligosaccharide flippase family protein [Agrococcus sp. SCSIO52902]
MIGATRARPARRTRGRWHQVGSAAAAKVVVMALTGIVGLVTSRIILDGFGVEAYAQYGLLASLPALLPFADLGIAAVLINAAAESEDPRRDALLRRTITSALRILLVAGGIIAAASLLLGAFDAWPAILGPGLMSGGGWVAAACMAIFGLTLPLTIGARLLVGLGRNTTQIFTQALTAPLILVLIGGCALLGVPAGQQLAVFAYMASAAVASTSLVVAARIVSPQLGAAAREVPHLRQAPSVPVMHLALPMLVQMLALPATMHTARILISHLDGAEELADYNLASQLFGIALQTIAAAGLALWPIFARARAADRVDSPRSVALWFLGGGLVLGGGVAVLAPWLVELVSAGKLTLDPLLLAAFVLFVAAQAAKYPLGMYMTDARGLRFQVVPTLMIIPIGLGMSLWLIPVLGAAGSVIAVTAAVVVCQVLPNVSYVARDLRDRRAAQAAQ